jgi:uncharacterized protein YkwD
MQSRSTYARGASLLAWSVAAAACSQDVDPSNDIEPVAVSAPLLAATTLFSLAPDGAAIVDQAHRHNVTVYPNAASVTPSAVTDDDQHPALHFVGGWLEVTNAVPESAGDFQFTADEDVRLSFSFAAEDNGERLKDTQFADRMHLLGLGGETTNIDVDLGDVEATSNEPDAKSTACWTYWSGGGIPNIVDKTNTDSKAYLDGSWHKYALERHHATVTVSVDGNVLDSYDVNGPIGSADNGMPNYIGRESIATGKIMAPLGPYPAAAFPWFGYIANVRLENISADGPIEPPPGNPPPTELAPEWQALLDQHNVYRDKHCVPALKWDQDLANSAQAWANQCHLDPNDPLRFDHSNTPGQGENLKWGSGNKTPTSVTAVDDWYAEISNYDYALQENSNTGVIGHFTQVVWRESTLVGCAKNLCANVSPEWGGSTLYVCEYAPQGNIRGDYGANVTPVCK